MAPSQVVSSKIDHRGMLSGYGLWWSADLGGHAVTSDPSNAQRSWKQLVRWLDEPRFVEEQEEIQVHQTSLMFFLFFFRLFGGTPTQVSFLGGAGILYQERHDDRF